jgi:Bifunctional DNA primase/polymerase, N-terminal
MAAIEILAAALDYAKRGIPVFPVTPTAKKKPFTTNGLYDATTDENQVRTWWKQWPKAMIGAPTGEKSGFWVLDPDVDAAKNLNGPVELNKLLTIHGPLPPTRGATTPRGHHYHFRMNGADIRNSSSKIAPGIDVRGTGGYVVLPPSVRNTGAVYQWCGSIDDALANAPDWLVELAREANNKTKTQRPQPQPRGKNPGVGSTRDERWARKILEEECALIAAAPDGQRNDTLNTHGYNLFRLVGGGYLDENEVRSRLWLAAEANGSVAEDANEVRGTINSASAGISNPRYRLQTPGPQPGPRSSLPPSGPSAGIQPGPGSGSGTPPPSGPSTGAHPGPAGPQPIPGGRPTIQLIEGDLPRVIDQAEAALLADIARQQLYQRGELVVRPVKLKLRAADMQGNKRETSGWQLLQLTKPYMVETFTRVARFERWNERVKDWTVKNCPGWVAETYLARAGRWKIPVLLRIVNAPFLRSDGSLCERPGYDPDSALLYILSYGQSFPSVPTIPTLQQAREALNYLDSTLFEEFPFVEKVDRSVALSLVLTALDRHAMATAPLHAFTSPVAGTGKSLLVDIASLLAGGEITPVISQGSNKDETEKRLGAELLSGNAIVSFDNCSTEIDSELLCQALTQRELRVRELGYSRNVRVPITALFTVNGNNLIVANDLTRRTLLCQLDAGMERPETRKFNRRVNEVAREQRGELVAAALTILRGWHMARTTLGIEPMGSFEEWSYRIRCPLLWLDRSDPCDSIQTVRENDPLRSLLNAVLIEWKKALGTIRPCTVQQIIDEAVKLAAGQLGIGNKPPIPPDRDFYHALATVAAAANGNSISNDRLGRWLNKNNGKIVGRLKLARVGMKNGYPFWQVIEN